MGRSAPGAMLCAAVATFAARAAAQVGSDVAERRAEAQNDTKLPELLEFVEAEYPAEAAAKGLEADVVLALEIDETGKVTGASVVESGGAAFDQAARAAALRFVFKPAERRGRPVKSRILYRYSFHYTAPPEPAAPPVASLSASVLVAGVDQPLAGARVIVAQNGTKLTELSTDAAGHFALDELEPGSYEITIQAAGFEPFGAVERLGPSEEVAAKYRLVPAVEAETEVFVHGTRPSREVTRRTLTRRKLSRVPGTSGDALRALQTLPGVARPPSLSGVLAVRGTGDQATPVFVDGLFLPNVYHFGGLSSVVPTEMIDELNFYPGNFGVRFGRALGGIVDIHLRETRADHRYHGLLQLDLIDVRGLFEGPVPGLDGWNAIAGFRRSHVDVWLTPLLEGEDTDIQAAPVYYDYQLLADTRPTPKSYLRLGLVGADDRFRLVSEASAMGGELESSNSSWGVGAIYQARLSDVADLDLSLTLARLRQRFQLSTILADTLAYGSIARGELSFRLWENATLRLGYDVLLAPYELKGQLPEDPGSSAPDVGSFVTTPTRRVDQSALFFQPALYAEMDMKPNARTQVVTGVRTDYDLDNTVLDVSPRISARYDVVPAFPRTTLKAGTGLFHQPPGLAETVLSDEATQLRSQRSWQNSLGAEQELTEHVGLSVEGFFNLLDNLISRGPDAEGTLRYNNFGAGRIFGLEAMLRYDSNDLFGWLSYTLSRSERRLTPGEPSRLFGLDQTHILSVVASYELGKGWELGGRFRYVTGNLYTPCIAGIFSSTSASYLCVNGAFNSERLPPFHELDVRVDKRWVFSGFTLGVYLDLINAYNRTNPDFIQYNYNYTLSRPQTGSLPIIPSLGVRGEF